MGEPLVIVGQGMAAARLVDELTLRALGRYSIIVIGAEPRRAYNRVLLSSLLAGEMAAGDLELKTGDWFRARGVTNVFGRAVTAVDRDEKLVTLADGARIPYSKLVMATGSDPIMLPKPGMNLPGVISFRTMDDADLLLAHGQGGKSAVVIGGGLLGLEAAYGLAKAGGRVTLVHLMDRLMERQLDAPAAALLKEKVAAKGVDILLGADTARVIGTDRAEGIELVDGRVIKADLVVCAIGVKPRVDLARQMGLTVNRGIVVDDGMTTSDPDVFALGECAEHRGVAYGLVEPAYEQARILARRLSGEASAGYEGTLLSTNLKVSGVSLFSAGDFTGGAASESVVYEDAGTGIYKKLVIENDALKGAVLFGDTADGLWYLELMRSGRRLEKLRPMLAFGRELAEAA
jgi:nitrite reductase (NADH) large subunit